MIQFREERIVNLIKKLLIVMVIVSVISVGVIELEVIYWWILGGEVVVVVKFVEVFDVSGDIWVDGVIVGLGGIVCLIIVSCIFGGDLMGVIQFNYGCQVEELIEVGLMLDLIDVVEVEGWKDIVYLLLLLDSCILDGCIYCVFVNIYLWQWLWLLN